ncbi:group II intron maturase-specific domain-containing protein [Methanospirillum stamsii]
MTLYHKHAVSSDEFYRLDHIVKGMLYSCVKRRLSNKGKHGITYWY